MRKHCLFALVTVLGISLAYAEEAPVKPADEAAPNATANLKVKDAPAAVAKEEAAPTEPAPAGAKVETPAKDDAAKPGEPAKPDEKPADVPAKKNAKPGKNADVVVDAPSASYFGVKAEGNRFVFVLDNSNSMVMGKFDTACYQLINTVSGLTEKQEFYVLLFSDTTYPLFYPTAAPGYVKATSQTKAQLYEWLKTVECVQGTNAKDAMSRALAVKPDAIFLLSDGNFTDDTESFLLAQRKGNTKVFTLALKSKEVKPGAKGGASKPLTAIAEHFGGTYTTVGLMPQFAAVERPKNSKPDGIWGIGLGKKKDK